MEASLIDRGANHREIFAQLRQEVSDEDLARTLQVLWDLRNCLSAQLQRRQECCPEHPVPGRSHVYRVADHCFWCGQPKPVPNAVGYPFERDHS